MSYSRSTSTTSITPTISDDYWGQFTVSSSGDSAEADHCEQTPSHTDASIVRPHLASGGLLPSEDLNGRAGSGDGMQATHTGADRLELIPRNLSNFSIGQLLQSSDRNFGIRDEAEESHDASSSDCPSLNDNFEPRQLGSMSQSASSPSSIRILALHGAKSNKQVTNLQLMNLKILRQHSPCGTEDENGSEEYVPLTSTKSHGHSNLDVEVVHLEGIIEVEEGEESLLAMGVQGPFYSWLGNDIPPFSAIGNDVIKSVLKVLDAVEKQGPFDGVYAFSSGAVIATLAMNIMEDTSLQKELFKAKHGHNTRSKVFGMGQGIEQECVIENNKQVEVDEEAASNARVCGEKPPFKFAILACAGATIPMASLRRVAALAPTSPQCSVPSFHIIGVNDSSFRPTSQSIVELYDNCSREVWYLSGGHGIGREERKDEELLSAIQNFMRRAQRFSVTSEAGKVWPEYTPVTRIASIATFPERQISLAQVDLVDRPSTTSKRFLRHRGGPPSRLNLENRTILDMIKRQPPHAPFLRIARSENPDFVTKYRDVLEFIRNDGNLSEHGVKYGDVVAYCAPDGGGAVSALAFLSIAAQTVAAPLAPNTSEPDALQAFKQFRPSTLILFQYSDGSSAYGPGIRAAFEAYSRNGECRLLTAQIVGGHAPGIFKFLTQVSEVSERETQGSEPKCDLRRSFANHRHRSQIFAPPRTLENPACGTCLLLRTSGTTSTPKVVPLKQGQLVANGEIIAASMGLTSQDICYSIMPLYHIGGISASICATLAAGATVCCDDKSYDPGRMVDALANHPQPTYYSGLPSIHNRTVTFLREIAAHSERYQALGIERDGSWKHGHSLRIIRSGAAALSNVDGLALAKTYGVPVYPTYSMSEQMPISSPPVGKVDTLETKPDSVGVACAASIAIVNSSSLRPLPYGSEGEIAIAGDLVMSAYLDNPDANARSFFHLTMPGSKAIDNTFFLTGDIGMLDHDGFLFLKGRSKEMIKKGGEQISPYEIEPLLKRHNWVEMALCFAVPSPLYGEEVGCAIVLSTAAPSTFGVKHSKSKSIKSHSGVLRRVISEMRALLREQKISPEKFPTKWKLVQEEDLPKTKTGKFIRSGLSTALGMNPTPNDVCPKKVATTKAKMNWKVLSGLRFCLACYVMFMHIGSNSSWGPVNNLRGFPWHVHLFFTLGGYTMASPMAPPISRKFSYFKARIRSMLPMYYVALFLCIINLLVACRPSTFDPNFHWDAQPDDMHRPLFCEGTPALKTSYWASLFLTLVIYGMGLQMTPFWFMSWFLGYYLWFSAMYYQCLAIFPILYNQLHKMRSKARTLFYVLVSLIILNIVFLCATWFPTRNAIGYEHYDKVTGELNSIDQRSDGSINNALVLGLYLFAPFWVIYFAMGVSAAFLYDALRPAEHHRAKNWGWLADLITLVMIATSAALVSEGSFDNTKALDENRWRPDEANAFADAAQTRRYWDALSGRFFAPITLLWLFALSTGRGYTAKFLKSSFLVDVLSPTSYHCFLFHQIIAQWYFSVTRGQWWYWWGYRKEMYWFSPQPCPVEWYEYPYIVGLTVLWSKLMIKAEQLVDRGLTRIGTAICKAKSDVETETSLCTAEVICKAIEDMTGIVPQLDYTLEESGLGSIGIPVLVAMLNKCFAEHDGTRRLQITASTLIQTKTISDMVNVVDEAKAKLEQDGV